MHVLIHPALYRALVILFLASSVRLHGVNSYSCCRLPLETTHHGNTAVTLPPSRPRITGRLPVQTTGTPHQRMSAVAGEDHHATIFPLLLNFNSVCQTHGGTHHDDDPWKNRNKRIRTKACVDHHNCNTVSESANLILC